MTTPARRATTALTSLLVAAAGVVATGAATAPAHAAPVEITGASFTWGLSGYAQVGALTPWRFFGPTGNATILRGSVSGGDQNEYVVAPVPSTSMPATSPRRTPNAVKLTGGTGTADPDTGALSLSWSGSYTVNAYAEFLDAPDETYSDPRLTVAADGSGSLTAGFVIGAGIDRDGDPTPATDLGRITVLEFAAGARSTAGDDRYTLVPAYLGVTLPGADQATCTTAGGRTGWWGSWPTAFVSALPDSIRPHYYSTGCGGRQDNKPPLPVAVDLSPPASSSTTVSAPGRRFGQPATASVVVASSSATSGTVTLVGLGAARTASVVGGRATFALGEPAAKAYDLTAAYSGNATTASSRSTVRLTISKAATAVATKVTRKPTTKRVGKLKTTVTSGTTSPTGKVTIVLYRGTKAFKTINARLKKRTATVTLPTKAKGGYRAVVTYAGNADVAGSTRTASYRITR
ncbi:hypothetical protein ABFT23_20515 [Nocardioides sp. C4-1]|uniref:hypothetical protein n=1 Tax=Nocardioides sp. C4-1 TaxID=3151851 RepID=UPI00326674D6